MYLTRFKFHLHSLFFQPCPFLPCSPLHLFLFSLSFPSPFHLRLGSFIRHLVRYTFIYPFSFRSCLLPPHYTVYSQIFTAQHLLSTVHITHAHTQYNPLLCNTQNLHNTTQQHPPHLTNKNHNFRRALPGILHRQTHRHSSPPLPLPPCHSPFSTLPPLHSHTITQLQHTATVMQCLTQGNTCGYTKFCLH